MRKYFKTATILVLFAVGMIAGVTGSAFAVDKMGAGREKPTLNGQLKQVLGNYLKIQKLLAADSMKGLPGVASKLAKSADEAAKMAEKDKSLKKGKELAGLLKGVSKSAGKMGAADLKLLDARDAFKGMSESAIGIAGHIPENERPAYGVFYCEMADAKWMQADEKTRNPYYGKEMATCGEKISSTVSKGKETGHEGHDKSHEGHEGHDMGGMNHGGMH